MNEAAIGWIYLWTNRINGKRYIGQSWYIQQRRIDYLRLFNSSEKCWNRKCKSRYKPQAISHAHRKHGFENFDFDPIWVGYTTQIGLDMMEDYFIDEYDTMADNGNGYNLKRAGSRGRFSEASKQKMSKSRIGKYIGKNNPNYGKKITEEHRRKLSEAKQGEKHNLWGKKRSDETKQKLSVQKLGSKNPMARTVFCYMTNKKWDCVRDAADELQVNYSSLRLHLNGNVPSKRFSHLRYAD